jgi:two-component system, OmpR family, sensor histidine kinase KdpD
VRSCLLLAATIGLRLETEEAPGGEVERLRRRLERERRARRSADAIAEQSTRRLYEANELKRRFIASVSHELRTPAAAVQAAARLLEQHGEAIGAARRRELTSIAARNADVLMTLIENLLDFGKLEREGVATLGPSEVGPLVPTDVSELVRRVLQDLASMLTRHLLDARLAPGLVALVDAVAFQRILANLLDNAVKYSPVGSQISVTASVDEDRVILAVADEGPGIPAHERDLVFESFYRGESRVQLRTRGLGIGLAVTRALVEGMDGSVRVDATTRHGARLVVSLRRSGTA